MGRAYKFNNPDGIYFVSFSVVNRISIFIYDSYCDMIIENLKFSQRNKGLKLYAFCIMPNHIHLLFSSKEGAPGKFIQSFKSVTAKSILKEISSSKKDRRQKWLEWMFQNETKNHPTSKYQFWQHDNHPIEVWSNKFIDQKINYIHMNPVKAGLVDKEFYWKYSSARNYMMEDYSIIKIEML